MILPQAWSSWGQVYCKQEQHTAAWGGRVLGAEWHRAGLPSTKTQSTAGAVAVAERARFLPWHLVNEDRVSHFFSPVFSSHPSELTPASSLRAAMVTLPVQLN